MKKIKLAVIFLVVVALFAAVVVDATSAKQVEPKQVTPKATTEMKTAAPTVPQTEPLSGSRQAFRMISDVICGFGGESESDNYRIPVNSGGQPSATGISESDNYVVEAGYVHASFVMRGDANGDGVIDVGDVMYLINYLFAATSPPCPMEAGEAKCDGIVDIGDVIYLINYLFIGGSPPC